MSDLDDDGLNPPCAAPEGCDEPVARDDDGFPYPLCFGHLNEACDVGVSP